jgi:putative endonuclease
MESLYHTYVLYSDVHSKTYVGFTSDLAGRLDAHNHPQNKGWTKRYQPWVLLYSESFPTKSAAMHREL